MSSIDATFGFLADILDLTSIPEKADAVAPLNGLRGQDFWHAYHGMAPQTQELAQTELWLDQFFCGWSPGLDRPVIVPPAAPGPPIVVVPSPPVAPPPAIPETSTCVMLTMGLVLIWLASRRRVVRGVI